MILPSRAMVQRFDEVALIYYNPNIMPQEEYELRRQYVHEQAEKLGLRVVEFGYEHELWEQQVNAEKSAPHRCKDCYQIRLSRVSEWASEQGFTHFGTTLTISPYQDEAGITQIGKELGCKYNLEFFDESFSEYYYESRRVATDLNLYRQNYCGCMPSKAEAKKARDQRKAERKAKKAETKTAEK